MRMLFPVCFLLLSCAAGGPSTETSGSAETVSVSKLPNFSLSMVSGGTLDQTALLGKPAMVNFWHPK